MSKFVDDKYIHLAEDIEKMRQKFRMYISFSNQLAAKAIVLEILYNAVDECRNPRSPADKITIAYDEREDTIVISDNGRGIPLNVLETVLTTLNSGSNIDSGSKADLKTNTLGRNGVGTLAMTALGERTEVHSYRGGTENKSKGIVFTEGKKLTESEYECRPDKHGLTVSFKPSKILGKNTKIVWNQIREELINLQFLNAKKIKMSSIYTNKDGKTINEEYKTQPFETMLSFRNNKDSLISEKIRLLVEDDDITEEIGGKKFKRFLSMDIAFVYTDVMTPYIDSFCNGNNTIDAGSHLDGTIEGMCRYFQQITKNSLTERDKIDIKWDDVKLGLSLVVSLNTNMEEIFTSQTKHKILNEDLEKLIRDKVIEALQKYFKQHPNKLKEIISIVKINAKARREGDKARNAVVKETMTNWGSFKMRNYTPCVNKGKEYKELYIIEGDSAKGSLNLSRNPKFQALFAIRGVSANVFKLDLNGVLENKEFNDLIKVMGCNVGSKFDLSKLQFNKIIIASDADVDGLFIRSLLCSFFFKVFPEIIEDGRLFIAEPPLYRVDDKKDPFVINKEDYLNRYIKNVVKEYQIGGRSDKPENITFLDKNSLKEFLYNTGTYVDDLLLLAQHYKVNDVLLEMIFQEFSDLLHLMNCYNASEDPNWESTKVAQLKKHANIEKMMINISGRFPEIYYEDKDQILKGVIDGRYQSIELSDRLIRKGFPLIDLLRSLHHFRNEFVLKNIKTSTEQVLSLLETLKVLKKFQPNIEARFKGLGENNPDDIKHTTMDPNTRSLIRVHISDIENDMKVFQVLRGTSPADASARKLMMRSFKLDRSQIDT